MTGRSLRLASIKSAAALELIQAATIRKNYPPLFIIASPDLSGRGNLGWGWRKQATSVCHCEEPQATWQSRWLNSKHNRSATF
jgi:hypothetical protein